MSNTQGTQATQASKAQGKIVQCIGAVVDVEFPRDKMPKIYDALKMEGGELTLEVQQQLGDGVVRTIALGSSDGLRRGLTVVNTGAAISVPVGRATLGPNDQRDFYQRGASVEFIVGDLVSYRLITLPNGNPPIVADVKKPS